MRRERRAIAFAVLGVLLLSSLAVLALGAAERADEEQRLAEVANTLATNVTVELQRMADMGVDVGVAVARLDELDAASYARLLGDLDVDTRFPGVLGVNLVAHVSRDRLGDFLALREAEGDGFELDDGGEEQLRIVSYVYPEPSNRSALGVDLTSRPDSRAAADRAVVGDAPALTPFTDLVQLDGNGPGASLHVPARDIEGRLVGTVGVVFAIETFLDQLAAVPSTVTVELRDRASSAETAVVLGPPVRDGRPTATVEIEAAGQTWELAVAPTQRLGPPWTRRGSTYLALAGLVGATMIGLLVRSIASRERVSWELVDQRTAELSRVNEELASTNRALADAGRTKDEFLASVSHELRTPLTVISGFVESMERMHGTQPGVSELLDPIQRNVRRLDGLVADLLTLASLDAGAVTPLRVPVELSAVLRSAPRELAGLRDDEVVLDVPAGLQTLVDPRHLERALINLLTNAMRHGRPPIELRAHDGGDGAVVFSVRDHGLGIPPEAVDEVFERFARGPGTGSTTGTGLGLAIVRELIEINGGSVDYQDAGPGARFVVRLEGVSGDAAAARAGSSAPSPPDTAQPSTGTAQPSSGTAQPSSGTDRGPAGA